MSSVTLASTSLEGTRTQTESGSVPNFRKSRDQKVRLGMHRFTQVCVGLHGRARACVQSLFAKHCCAQTSTKRPSSQRNLCAIMEQKSFSEGRTGGRNLQIGCFIKLCVFNSLWNRRSPTALRSFYSADFWVGAPKQVRDSHHSVIFFQRTCSEHPKNPKRPIKTNLSSFMKLECSSPKPRRNCRSTDNFSDTCCDSVSCTQLKIFFNTHLASRKPPDCQISEPNNFRSRTCPSDLDVC